MSDESKGVVTFRATRITMIDAIGDALPASGKRWRRKYPLAVPDLADAIMAVLPVVEPSALKAITEAERIIAERDEEIARQARVIRDVQGAASDMGERCDELFALNRALREQAAEGKEQILALSQQLTAAYDAAGEFRKAADQGAEARHDIDLILDGVPGLSQDHPGQAGAVAELAERCKAAEAKAARSGEIADGLRGRRAKLVRELADVTVRADRAEAELARVAAALAPLTVTTGMTHAERALAAGVIRDSISLPAPARPEGLTVHACQVDETGADPYQGLGSGGIER